MTGARMSMAKLAILQVMVGSPNDRHWGYNLIKASGVKSGSLYPILRQLEEWRWVTRRRENHEETDANRPLRYYYKLTKFGLAQAREALANAPVTVSAKLQGAS